MMALYDSMSRCCAELSDGDRAARNDPVLAESQWAKKAYQRCSSIALHCPAKLVGSDCRPCSVPAQYRVNHLKGSCSADAQRRRLAAKGKSARSPRAGPTRRPRDCQSVERQQKRDNRLLRRSHNLAFGCAAAAQTAHIEVSLAMICIARNTRSALDAQRPDADACALPRRSTGPRPRLEPSRDRCRLVEKRGDTHLRRPL